MTRPDDRDERPIAHFTEWMRQRPNSFEFWELVLTDQRIIWCFVGESYRSMLLRSDMGERDRHRLEERPIEELETLAEENFTVPIGALTDIHLLEGTRFRRPRLEVKWRPGGETGEAARYDGSMTLVGTSTAASHRELFDDLSGDSRLSHVDTSRTTRKLPFL